MLTCGRKPVEAITKQEQIMADRIRELEAELIGYKRVYEAAFVIAKAWNFQEPITNEMYDRLDTQIRLKDCR